MNVVSFEYRAKFGHFLRAEANANGITYPVPPRTVLLGLLGAVLGLEKDAPQTALRGARLAVGGAVPRRFWHKTNVRKDPPAPLPFRVTAKARGSDKEQRNFRFPQEYLWRPAYRVWANLPEPHQVQLSGRLRRRRWHFTPSMGLSELLADLEFVAEDRANPLGPGVHRVQTVAPHDAGRVDTAAACQQGLAVQSLRMPFDVTPDRVFSHRTYLLEHQGRPFPFHTEQAWRCGEDVVVFL